MSRGAATRGPAGGGSGGASFSGAIVKVIDDPAETTGLALLVAADLQEEMEHDEVGGQAFAAFVIVGRPDAPAGGYASAMVPGGIMYGSTDPANEMGGIIGALHIGADVELPGGLPIDPGVNDPDDNVVGTLWGESWTLRSFPAAQPGGLVGYTAVVQNLFNGSGSRMHNAGFVAITQPGIGDGHDFFSTPGEGFRYEDTFPVDHGFIVTGRSGVWGVADGVGFRVAFQAGGRATAWTGDYDPTDPTDSDGWSKIETGLLVRDWTSRAIKIHAPHADAANELAIEVVDDDDDTLFSVGADGQVTSVKEGWHLVGAGGGEPAFEHSYTNVTAPPFPAAETAMQFRLVDGYVEIAGMVTIDGVSDLNSTDVFHLPAGYRPSAEVKLLAQMLGAGGLTTGQLVVGTAGGVSFFVPSFTGVVAARVLVGTRFPLDAPALAA